MRCFSVAKTALKRLTTNFSRYFQGGGGVGGPVWVTVDTALLERLCERLEAAWEPVAAGFAVSEGRALQCAPGCADCCRAAPRVAWSETVDLQLLWPEAARLWQALRALPEATRALVYERAAAYRVTGGAFRVCPCLDAAGRCVVYAARPLVCRITGLPVQYFSPTLAAWQAHSCRYNRLARDPHPVADQRMVFQAVSTTAPAWVHSWTRILQEVDFFTDAAFRASQGQTVSLGELLDSLAAP